MHDTSCMADVYRAHAHSPPFVTSPSLHLSPHHTQPITCLCCAVCAVNKLNYHSFTHFFLNRRVAALLDDPTIKVLLLLHCYIYRSYLLVFPFLVVFVTMRIARLCMPAVHACVHGRLSVVDHQQLISKQNTYHQQSFNVMVMQR